MQRIVTRRACLICGRPVEMPDQPAGTLVVQWSRAVTTPDRLPVFLVHPGCIGLRRDA